jgi:CubicO group peptidase (beta-lactamase class C family)
MAFTYIAYILAKMVDEGTISLDDKLSTWLPDLPRADQITLKNLLNMTSGYADYVYQPETTDGMNRDPFRQWTPEELIRIGVTGPKQYDPGTNWGYSHTNFVILGRVIEKISGQPMAAVLKEYIYDPMGLTATQSFDNGTVPEPALHVFSAERRGALGIKPETPFYEESTYWNPSWTTAQGAIMVTDMKDVTTSLEKIGRGEGLSPEMHQAMLTNYARGLGHKQAGCDACNEVDDQHGYGLGLLQLGAWISQIMNFSGHGATMGYLPSQDVAIVVGTTVGPDAFDAEGNYPNPTIQIFGDLGAAMAPDEAPPR